MVVGTAGDNAEVVLCQPVGHRRGIADQLPLVELEALTEGLSEGNCLGGDDMHQGPTLNAREHGPVQLLGELLLAQHQSASGTPQGLVSRGGHEIAMWQW